MLTGLTDEVKEAMDLQKLQRHREAGAGLTTQWHR